MPIIIVFQVLPESVLFLRVDIDYRGQVRRKYELQNNCWISGSHSGDPEEYFLGCVAV